MYRYNDEVFVENLHTLGNLKYLSSRFFGGGVVECTVRTFGNRTDAAPVSAKFITEPFLPNKRRATRVTADIINVLPVPAVPWIQ